MNTEQTLGDLVTTRPSAAKVLQRYRLDYCCGGEQSLKQACAAKKVDPETVLHEIDAGGVSGREDMRWDQRPLDELVKHILHRYHAPLKTEIPRLVELARKVERAHADKPDRPDGLAALLADIQAAVESHLTKEERLLFPAIVAGRGPTTYMPVRVMMQEHHDHGENLRRIRQLTEDLTAPEHACASWRELYRSLAELEVDLMDHIHLENNILFPRALAG
jgi:regulator of cell morphogenesis and NO signaling